MQTLIFSHARASAIIIMVAIFILSSALTLIASFVAHNRIVERKIDQHTNNALRDRDKQIEWLSEKIMHQQAVIQAQKERIAQISVFLGKAVQASGVNNDEG